MTAIVELFFLPPLAIGRLGGSDTPLESFRWGADNAIHAAHRTVIEPAVTLEIAEDGTPLPYVPSAIRFRDAEKLRPVAPFFELWVRIQEAQAVREVPLTLDLLNSLGVEIGDLRFRISAANKKAQRRTQQVSCSFVARVEATGNDHARKPLLASSPHDPDHQPLVFRDAPVPLGSFQVVRPLRATVLGVDLSVVRVRFTPAKGEVYGPPTAIASISSPLPEGENMVWDRVMQGRMHEMVKPENRILNPNSAWSHYVGAAPGQIDPQPQDSYDGAKCGDQTSFGVVDDTCDGLIEAHLVVEGTRFDAYARVTASPPDYAPDRRPFISVADDLADRDLPEAAVSEQTLDVTEDEIADLFNRVFETATQINLDAERYRGVVKQRSHRFPPKTDLTSMTGSDQPYARLSGGLITDADAVAGNEPPTARLPYTEMAKVAHASLTDIYELLDFLAIHAVHVRQLVRPPFGRFGQFAVTPGEQPNPQFRDPRVERDIMHDMRMPPYMRDSDCNPLSLTWRQYQTLMKLVDLLAPPATGAVAAHGGVHPAAQAAAPAERHRARSRIERRVAAVLAARDQSVRPR
jgi:hypothetical protein